MKSTILTVISMFALAAGSYAAEEAKEINALADAPVIGDVLSKFSASATVDYESEFIFRGKELAGPVISPELDLSYDIGAGVGAYVGWWGCYSTDGSGYEENDLYVGLTYDIENFSFNLGYTVYTYPADGSINEHEFKFCASYDTSDLLGDFAISPYVAGYYNLTYSGTTIEGGLSYSAPITEWIIGEKWGSLDLSVFCGYSDYIEGMSDNGGYVYAGMKADFSVKITEYWSISTGIRYACNNDNDGGYVARAGKEENLWFGAATSIGF